MNLKYIHLVQQTVNKDIRKLKKLIDEYLGKSKDEIRAAFSTPSKKSDNEVWFYRKFYLSPFNDEILFIFENDIVIDISISKYYLWKEVKSVFYMEEETPEYKEISLL